MQFYFPNDARFNADNFAYQPLTFVFQALRAIDKHLLENANQSAIPIAGLGVATLSSQGVKNPKIEWFNPYAKMLESFDEMDAGIPGYVSETFSQLSKEGKVPSWATNYLEID